MQNQAIESVPLGWVAEAHNLWLAGKRNEAIQAVIFVINSALPAFPQRPATQFAYYLYMLGDWPAASSVFGRIVANYPQDKEALLNLGICQNRAGDYASGLKSLEEYLQSAPDDYAAWDAITAVCHRLKLTDRAREAGSNSLALKDRQHQHLPEKWSTPRGKPSKLVQKTGKYNVISYSLWGNNPRYLRGALRNALIAPDIYPGWRCQFHVDSLPAEFLDALRDVGAEIVIHSDEQASNKQRLARRFWVANDPHVGYFLVRDCDSVIGPREAQAVRAWIASERCFHVMRDWWTHTDLVLAGMWGGVAGVLPDLSELFDNYQSEHVETPNWDQWFLRDCVWAYIRKSCLIHDRCFTSPGSLPFPGTTPEGNYHVGQDEHAVSTELQAKMLEPWITKLACLR